MSTQPYPDGAPQNVRFLMLDRPYERVRISDQLRQFGFGFEESEGSYVTRQSDGVRVVYKIVMREPRPEVYEFFERLGAEKVGN